MVLPAKLLPGPTKQKQKKNARRDVEFSFSVPDSVCLSQSFGAADLESPLAAAKTRTSPIYGE